MTKKISALDKLKNRIKTSIPQLFEEAVFIISKAYSGTQVEIVSRKLQYKDGVVGLDIKIEGVEAFLSDSLAENICGPHGLVHAQDFVGHILFTQIHLINKTRFK